MRPDAVIILVVYRAAADARPADWVVASLRTFAESVLSVVPAGFEEYVRVFNPAYRGSWSDWVPVTWAEVAHANGMQMHPLVQFGSITGHELYEWKPQPGVFDQPPMTGSIDRNVLHPLASVLARHTETPGECWFAIWEGWGTPADDPIRSAPTFSLPARTYHLLIGPVEAVHDLAAPLGAQTPSLWWPEDHAWCVATEVDFKTSYIGADRRCAQGLVSLPGVETATVSPDAGITWLSDPVNPRQPR